MFKEIKIEGFDCETIFPAGGKITGKCEIEIKIRPGESSADALRARDINITTFAIGNPVFQWQIWEYWP